ncbi:protein-L-isoaspartate O-methyltransferase [Candidatus Wolfebacteria bacterium]|nr:protein-L-isoaspartate O-methyltransferase [Candidatus Wolfebacteria bacterium]
MSPDYENLINSLIKDGYLRTPAIIDAFKAIDRADFVSDEYKNDAYVNAPLPIGFEQTISQPLVVAFMIELLEPKAGEKILDVGAGSGWQTAILSYIVSQNDSEHSGKIIGLERIPELANMAEKNISKYDFFAPAQKVLDEETATEKDIVLNPIKGIAKIIKADGSKGYKKEAPYDKIIAGASAMGDVPIDWRKQLKIGGRIVAPVGQSIVVIDKTGKGKYSGKEFFGFSFVPLIRDQKMEDRG